MIRGLLQIGEIVKGEPWEISLNIAGKNEREDKYVVKLDFDVESGNLNVDIEQYIPEVSERKYKLVKLTLTSRQNQFVSSFVEYKKRLFGESGKPYASWISVIDELENSGIDVPESLMKVREIFYENGVLKDEYREAVEAFLNEHRLSRKNLAFFTVLIDGKPVSEMEEYISLLNGKILEKKQGDVICHLCGRKVSEFVDDFKRFTLKIFINDKVGFSQHASDFWEGNFAICPECYVKYLGGERFVLNHLSASLGYQLRYAVIPEFSAGTRLSDEDFRELGRDLMERVNPFYFVEDVKQVERELDRVRDFEEEGVWVNYLFYATDKSSVDVYGIIYDVPYGRLKDIRDRIKSSGLFLEKIFPDLQYVKMRSLRDVFNIIPLRVSGGKLFDAVKVVSLFNSILSQIPIDWKSFVGDFVLGAKIHFFGTGGYQISKKVSGSAFNEMDMVSYLLRTHHFIRFLSGGGDMERFSFLDDIGGDIKEYIQTLGLDEEAAALFLLGYLIGEIGVRQYRDYGHKPVLNKINFQGMDQGRLLVLFNEVMEKLHQMKLYGGVEKIYNESKKLVDKNLRNWSKSPQENVYYLLSGYAYRTAKALSKGGDRNE